MQKINTPEMLNNLIESYFRKNTITNNYMMVATSNDYIAQGRLFMLKSLSNAFILLEKNDFYQLYFYLNDLNELINNLPDKPVVMEILYRGESHRPGEVIEYWEKCGFHQHLIRDNMMAAYKQLTMPVTGNPEVNINFAESSDDISFVKELLERSLDKYTGDQLSIEELNQSAANKKLLLAWFDNKPAGFLRFEIKHNVIWLGHIVVTADFRGKGIANELVLNYIRRNETGPETRYQLWVIQDNKGAVSLYRKFGFVYGNKSTISMLKE